MVNDGSLEQVHTSNQRTVVNQIRQGILADKLRFQTSSSPSITFSRKARSSALILCSLRRRLRRTPSGSGWARRANIITWHHPVRIAEQAAILDIVSGGRLEFGIGRGYQPREAEVFGWPFSTIQDQERNRAFYQEAYDIILKCWTKPSFFHQGQFYTIPPV